MSRDPETASADSGSEIPRQRTVPVCPGSKWSKEPDKKRVKSKCCSPTSPLECSLGCWLLLGARRRTSKLGSRIPHSDDAFDAATYERDARGRRQIPACNRRIQVSHMEHCQSKSYGASIYLEGGGRHHMIKGSNQDLVTVWIRVSARLFVSMVTRALSCLFSGVA